MSQQPYLPHSNPSANHGFFTRNFKIQLFKTNGSHAVDTILKDLSSRRNAIHHYLQLYQQHAFRMGSGAIINSISFAVSDYNSFIRDIFNPIFPPDEFLYDWEKIHFWIHQVANHVEPRSLITPQDPPYNLLIRHLQRAWEAN